MSNSSAEPSGLKVTECVDNLSQKNVSDARDISGPDTLVVGLAPTFWTHLPLLIHDLQCNVHLLKGVNCLLLNSGNEIAMRYVPLNSSDVPMGPSPIKIVPISKCTLVGTIVSMERKSNGCVMYVLDDGSGLMDVVQYIEDDCRALPSLTGLSERSDCRTVFAPGDLVRVFGRIHCVSIVQSEVRPGKSVTREVHASLILSIDTRSNSRGQCSSFEKEYDHWMDCARCLQQFGVNRIHKESDVPTLPILSNSLDMMRVLGLDLSTQLLDAISRDKEKNDNMSWQVFGRNCQCSNVLLKRELLYCHCIATPDANLDPELKYRDALLTKLLQMESEYIHAGTRSRDPVQEDDVLKTIALEEACDHFRFRYSDIVLNEELNQVAFDVLQKAGMLQAAANASVSNDIDRESMKPFGQVRRLIRSTFRHLWKDGIIYLVDADTDLYLLISRIGVLEPHVKSRTALQKLSAETRARYYAETSRPRYLDHVSRPRLQFVRRSLSEK
jgi:hypothetical protein